MPHTSHRAKLLKRFKKLLSKRLQLRVERDAAGESDSDEDFFSDHVFFKVTWLAPTLATSLGSLGAIDFPSQLNIFGRLRL